MRDYSKISSSFWTGKTGKSLRGNQQAQIIALYLMSCPHANMIGVFHCPIIYIAHETGSSIEGAYKGLNDLVDGAFCTYDHESETVWVHEMAKYQIGESLSPNDKQVIGIKKQFSNLPEGLIKQGFYARYKSDFILPEIEEKAEVKASPFEAPSKPEAGTEAGTEAEVLNPSAKASKEILPIPDFVNLENWNDFIEVRKGLKAKNTIQAMKALITQLKKLVADGFDADEVVLQSIRASWKDLYPIKNKPSGTYSNQREAGRNVAAKSIFTPENTQHLQGNQLKTINEVDHEEPRAIAA